MIIKKYKAKTENEAIQMAKNDLGKDAIVMNVKTIKPRGIASIFRKPRVELTAAIDDSILERSTSVFKNDSTVDHGKNVVKNIESKDNGEKTSQDGIGKSSFDSKAKEQVRFGKAFAESTDYSEEAQNAIEEKINNIAKLLEQQMKNSKVNENYSANLSTNEKNDSLTEEKSDVQKVEKVQNNSTNNKIVELIKKQLIANDVTEEYALNIIEEMEINDKTPIDNVLASAYQKIVLKLGEISSIKKSENTEEKKPKIIFFVGNTGVGKTTTMAKLASKCKLDKMSVAMFSVDTYRIAAIEQTKTYANILSAPMEVVYTPEDMVNNVEKHKNCDLIFVDTAGRSHRNEAQREDLLAILNSVSDYEREIYLVVSVTTKYSDLKDISDTYGKLFDYKIIFTKLDETNGVGSILNIKQYTGKSLSYVTWGQNVPEDIGVLNPQVIAKKLLGGGE